MMTKENAKFFHALPRIQKGPKEYEAITRKRRLAWLKSLNRTILNDKSLHLIFVCPAHFIGGKCDGSL